MEVLLLVGAIVILGVWTVWQEYRINRIREDIDNNRNLLAKHSQEIYGKHFTKMYDFYKPDEPISINERRGVLGRLRVIENELKSREAAERISRRKAAMKEYIFNDGKIAEADELIDKLYAMAIGLQESANKCEEDE